MLYFQDDFTTIMTDSKNQLSIQFEEFLTENDTYSGKKTYVCKYGNTIISGQRALEIACKKGNKNFVRYLKDVVNKGIEFDTEEVFTILVQHGQLDLLMDYYENSSVTKLPKRISPFNIKYSDSIVDAIEFLRNRTSKIRCCFPTNVLVKLVEFTSLKSIKYMSKYLCYSLKCSFNSDHAKTNALLKAVELGKESVFEYFILEGFNFPSTIDTFSLAKKSGNKDMIKLVRKQIFKLTRVKSKDDNIYSLIESRKFDSIQIAVVNHIVDINKYDYCWELIHNCKHMEKDLKIISFLVDRGLNIHKYNLLIQAIQINNLELIKFLVKKGANVFSTENNDGYLEPNYALKLAARLGHRDTFSFLLSQYKEFSGKKDVPNVPDLNMIEILPIIKPSYCKYIVDTNNNTVKTEKSDIDSDSDTHTIATRDIVQYVDLDLEAEEE